MSQCAEILAVPSDHRLHSIQEIHHAVGPCRLNSRIAELRKRVPNEIICHRDDQWVSGRRVTTYFYKLVPLSEAAIPSPPGRPALAASPSGRPSNARTEVTSLDRAEVNGNDLPLTSARSPGPWAATETLGDSAAVSAHPDPGESPGSELQLFDTRKAAPWA